VCWPHEVVGGHPYYAAMYELPDDPQTLYLAWTGRWPFRQWLYVGITNSPSRRFHQHRAHSAWMLEAATIRLKRYPDRESVMVAERLMIKAKRPYYNVQHNRQDVEVEVSGESLAALSAAICVALLGLRWLADACSAWWIQRQADRQGASVVLPPRRNPFTEPSVVLSLLEAFCARAVGEPLRQPSKDSAPDEVRTVPSTEPPAVTEKPGLSRHVARPVVAPESASGLPFGLVVALCLALAQGPTANPGPDRGEHR